MPVPPDVNAQSYYEIDISSSGILPQLDAYGKGIMVAVDES
jgi:hypothetical protein